MSRSAATLAPTAATTRRRSTSIASSRPPRSRPTAEPCRYRKTVKPEPLPGEFRDYDPIQPGTDWRALARRIWAPIAAAIGLLVKFSFVFFKFASIFIAVGGYALIWGWRFAAGFVLLILVHEMGHFVEARRQGLHPGLPVFIPFFGAYVAIRDASLNAWQNALI